MPPTRRGEFLFVIRGVPAAPEGKSVDRRAFWVHNHPFHQVSIKHLPAYLDEFEFRFNNGDNPYIFRDAMWLMLAS